MSKGEITKETIVKKAAKLFNVRGFASGSMSELMELTGLKKGGIYNHFQSKEEIAVEAFDYAIHLLNQTIHDFVRDEKTTIDKLKAVVNFYKDYPLNPVIEGGCPILNTAVEANDTNSLLKQRVQNAITNWIGNLSALIEKGIERGEIKNTIHAEEVSIVIISSIEGGIVLARSFDDNKYMKLVTNQLINYIECELKA